MDIEKNKIKNYIKKLSELNETMSKFDYDENINLDDIINFNDELNNVLSLLNNELYIKPNNLNINSIEIKIKKLDQYAIIPTYSRNRDAGLDLTVRSIIDNNENEITYGYGISIEIPEGFVGLIFPRSSIKKYDLLLTNSVGVIDSGYRGEIMSTFKKTHDYYSKTYTIGDRAAQIIILPYPKIKFIETNLLSDTERSAGGFGSTGE